MLGVMRNLSQPYSMRKYVNAIPYTFFLLTIFYWNSTKAQIKSVHYNCDSLFSQEEVYELLNFVIAEKKLDKSYCLNRKILENPSRNQSEMKFFKSLVIDSSRKFYNDIIDDSGKVSRIYDYPNLNILESEDIKFIKCQKYKFQSLNWDNSKLGFTEMVRSHTYSFSIPYFSFNKKIVILRYEYFCGTLCAGGQTLVMRKINGTWKIDWLESWIA